MRALLITLSFMLPALAQADIIKCHFTEPFITTTYSMAQQKLTSVDMENRTTVTRNVSFQIKGPGHFELWDRNRRVIQVIHLNFNGSDGMSDRRYPYEVHWNTRHLHGGCTSNFLHASEN